MGASQTLRTHQPNPRPPWTQPYRNRILCRSSSFDGSQITKSCTIRPISTQDIPRLALIQQQCQLSLATNIEEELDKALSRTATAIDTVSTEPIGYIVCWLIAEELQVLEVAVDPTHQSQGVASALLQHMLNTHSAPLGSTLEVKAQNVRAIRLYQRFGFKEVGRRPKYYPCGADAVLMTRHPQDPA